MEFEPQGASGEEEISEIMAAGYGEEKKIERCQGTDTRGE